MFYHGESSPDVGASVMAASPTKKSARRRCATTRSAQLRAGGIRLNCYLNCDGVGVGHLGGPQGHGTIVRLPVGCDTLEEVLIKTQQQLSLDSRMLYASELWKVDGTPIQTYKQLAQAAEEDAPVVVGCGEPFDGTRVPQDLLEFSREGGGRQGQQRVHKTLRERRTAALKEKAERVRVSGHGVNSEAVTIARTINIEQNREHVNEMRHKYMESLLIRAAQQESLMSSVKSNSEIHRMEAQESKARLEESRQIRMQELAAQRRLAKEEFSQKRQEALDNAKAQAAKVRSTTGGGKRSPSQRRAKSARPPRAAQPPAWVS